MSNCYKINVKDCGIYYTIESPHMAFGTVRLVNSFTEETFNKDKVKIQHRSEYQPEMVFSGYPIVVTQIISEPWMDKTKGQAEVEYRTHLKMDPYRQRQVEMQAI